LSRSWTDVPLSPRRVPFFYGWVIVAAGTVGTVSSIPGQTMGVGVFNDFLMDVLGLDATWLAGAYAAGTITSSFCLPFAGSLLDRIGARAMVVVSSVGLGLSMLLLSRCDTIAGFGGTPPFAAAVITIGLCFLAMRFFGQGCQTVVPRVMIGRWFDRRRGLATGVAGVFAAFAFNGGTYVLNHMVDRLGWRGTCLALAAGVGAGMGILGWIFYRDTPEECGLRPDGDAEDSPHAAAHAAKSPAREFTRAEAVRTAAFWAYSLAPASHALVSTAFFFHLSALGQEHGIARAGIYELVLYFPVFSVAANLIGAWLSDRISMRYLFFTFLAAEAAGTLGLVLLSTAAGLWMLVAGYGIAGGLFVVIMTVAFPQFFGRAHLGAISGLNMAVMVFASAIGPILFALGRDVTGSFTAITVACAFMPAVIAVMGLWARNPQESTQT